MPGENCSCAKCKFSKVFASLYGISFNDIRSVLDTIEVERTDPSNQTENDVDLPKQLEQNTKEPELATSNKENEVMPASPPPINEREDSSKWKNVTFAREGSKIILPEGMTTRAARMWLERYETEEQRDVAISETILAHPYDGALALARVLSRKYGWADMIPTPGFWGSSPPAMISLECGPNQTTQVAWGRLQIPNVTGFLETDARVEDGRWVFVLGGTVKAAHKDEIAKLAADVRQEVLENSVYRGKAIRVKFPKAEKGMKPELNSPKFMDTSKTNVDELIFSDEVQDQIQTNLFTPIERTQMCREVGIPLKRGVLLAGPYGTGKTLAATVSARKCVENGWTFIYLTTVDDLDQAIRFAQQYQPALIFAEDIDSVMTGDRDTDMNAILNTLDGVDSKAGDVFVVLTTNHVEKINKAMLRPGRLDAVITVSPPDAVAAERLIRQYARDTLQTGEDLKDVALKLKGHIPAVIREVVERSKLAAVSHTNPGEKLNITAKDLITATNGMLTHLAMMKTEKKSRENALTTFANGLGKHVASAAVEIAKSRSNGTEHEETEEAN